MRNRFSPASLLIPSSHLYHDDFNARPARTIFWSESRRNDFRKGKTDENFTESLEDLLEHHTDYTDTLEPSTSDAINSHTVTPFRYLCKVSFN